MTDTRTRLVNCFLSVFPALDPAEVGEASTASVQAWDSLGSVSLLMVVEEEFRVRISPDEMAGLTSFASLLVYLTRVGNAPNVPSEGGAASARI